MLLLAQGADVPDGDILGKIDLAGVCVEEEVAEGAVAEYIRLAEVLKGALVG